MHRRGYFHLGLVVLHPLVVPVDLADLVGLVALLLLLLHFRVARVDLHLRGLHRLPLAKLVLLQIVLLLQGLLRLRMARLVSLQIVFCDDLVPVVGLGTLYLHDQGIVHAQESRLREDGE